MSHARQSTRLPENATIRRPLTHLLGGAGHLTLTDMAARVGCSEEFAASFWLAMGFPQPAPDATCFTDADVDALKVWWGLAQSEQISPLTLASLLRAQSHTTDRLVLWQVEALVDENARRFDLDDTSARLLTLAKIDDLLDTLQGQVLYAWRRQMANLLVNTNAEVAWRGRDGDAGDAYPLTRTMGFVDMVAYTRRAAVLSSRQLADLVQRFELTARDVISARGGRVVKTIGDAILWIVHDLDTGADIVCDLIEALEAEPDMLAVRASLVCGRVVSRSGDIFGPSVNLASRLVDIVPGGQIFMDAATARAIAAMEDAHRFTCTQARLADLKGMGEVEAWRLERTSRR